MSETTTVQAGAGNDYRDMKDVLTTELQLWEMSPNYQTMTLGWEYLAASASVEPRELGDPVGVDGWCIPDGDTSGRIGHIRPQVIVFVRTCRIPSGVSVDVFCLALGWTDGDIDEQGKPIPGWYELWTAVRGREQARFPSAMLAGDAHMRGLMLTDNEFPV